jgi:hypothetical protein
VFWIGLGSADVEGGREETCTVGDTRKLRTFSMMPRIQEVTDQL